MANPGKSIASGVSDGRRGIRSRGNDPLPSQGCETEIFHTGHADHFFTSRSVSDVEIQIYSAVICNVVSGKSIVIRKTVPSPTHDVTFIFH